jgi:hypothetical protein
MSNNKSKAVNLDLMSDAERSRYESLSEDEKAEYLGYGEHARSDFDVPQYNKSQNERVIQKGGAFIVLGLDRPHNLLSQRMGSHVASIDIVVGRSGAKGRKRNRKGKLLNVDPNMTMDAARVYISQKCDIDGILNLDTDWSSGVGGTWEESPRSAVALKADTIRIVGRENIKLVTRTDQYNSLGGDISNISTMGYGIDLVALDDNSSLQPLVKGENLELCLAAIVDSVDELRGLFNNFVEADRGMTRALINHNHHGAFFGSPDAPDFRSMPEHIKSLIEKVTDVTAQLPLHATKTALIKTNYLGFVKVADTVDLFEKDYRGPGAGLNILSKYNSTN